MRLPHISKKILMIILIASITSSLTGIYVLSLTTLEPGLYITLRLYDVDKDKIFDVSYILQRGDVIWCVKTDVIAPFISENDFVNILNKCYRGSGAAFISYNKIKPVIDSWIKTYNLRNADVKGLISGMIISVFVMNISDKKILFKGFDVYSYKPYEYKDPKPVNIEITMIRGREHMYFTTKMIGKTGFSYISRSSEIRSDEEKYLWIEERIKYIIMPENLTKILPLDYFMNLYINEKVYMKTPILILENLGNYSGDVGIFINIHSPNIRSSFVSGDIFNRLLNSNSSSASDVYIRLGGYSWGCSECYFTDATLLSPKGFSWSSAWIYLWSRPLQIFSQLFVCDQTDCIWVEDRVYLLITDTYVYGSTIKGGSERGLPRDRIMYILYNNTISTEKLYIPDTGLEDGKLDPNEFVFLCQISTYFNKYGKPFEIGIPIGAFIGAAMCPALGLEIVNKTCVRIMNFVSAFYLMIPTSSMTPRSYLICGIQNYGKLENVPIGYNNSVYMYLRLSKYKYYQPPPLQCVWCPSQEHNMLAEIYFRSEPD